MAVVMFRPVFYLQHFEVFDTLETLSAGLLIDC